MAAYDAVPPLGRTTPYEDTGSNSSSPGANESGGGTYTFDPNALKLDEEPTVYDNLGNP